MPWEDRKEEKKEWHVNTPDDSVYFCKQLSTVDKSGKNYASKEIL